jgi:phage gpG-like protein
VLYSAVQDNFEAEGERGDHPGWVELSDARIKQREKKGKGPRPILEDEGLVVGSFEPFWDGQEAGISNNKTYAATHELGDERRNIL